MNLLLLFSRNRPIILKVMYSASKKQITWKIARRRISKIFGSCNICEEMIQYIKKLCNNHMTNKMLIAESCTSTIRLLTLLGNRKRYTRDIAATLVNIPIQILTSKFSNSYQLTEIVFFNLNDSNLISLCRL